jgi:hypothetical protein
MIELTHKSQTHRLPKIRNSSSYFLFRRSDKAGEVPTSGLLLLFAWFQPTLGAALAI